MKIVVLDSACALQKDLDFSLLKNFGELFVYERTPKDKVIERINNAEIVLTNKVNITKEIIDACPSIKFISILATGYNIIDLKYAKEKGIIVSNVPNYSTDSVVQHTFALILSAVCGIVMHNNAIKNGEWATQTDFCLYKSNLFELNGKTLGIIGYGAIGKKVSCVAKSFGMNVIFNTRTPQIGSVSLNELFERADIISLHCPLTDSNHEMINLKNISLMKNGVIIINTARGGLVNEKDILNGLNCNKISYYCADVLNEEPPKKTNELIKHPNTIITSHIAWATYEARKRLLEITKENIEAFISGSPINIVNK